ncbi:hypothetical protein OG455_09590 [Kitasatospora sp. NBC_01287]|uniref:hypothetical protein n=1 Tax=Kitasatospora sp. NBC_01287 TaxID=2903573 RepID=UPI002251AC5F|nr:hypothetical protein [Kitasatospora sp. NBC_01287]MCX4745772.1 hypothetical protein [Kitasatospora sp. NBC_01287]
MSHVALSGRQITFDPADAGVGSRPAEAAAPAAALAAAASAGASAGAVRPLVPRRVATVLTVLGVAMIPWLFFLHTGLPATDQAAHWAWTWTGLDSLEAAGLFATGLLLRRGDPRACLAAAATATLLLVDAWFDTMTAAPGSDLASSILMAVFAELPLAALCATLAVRGFPRAERR